MNAAVRFSDYPLGLRLVTLVAVTAVLAAIYWIASAVTDALPIWLAGLVFAAIMIGAAALVFDDSRRRKAERRRQADFLTQARRSEDVGLLQKEKRQGRIRPRR